MISCRPIFRKTKEHQGRLYLRIIHKRRKIDLPLKISISKSDWNNGEIKGEKTNYIETKIQQFLEDSKQNLILIIKVFMQLII